MAGKEAEGKEGQKSTNKKLVTSSKKKSENLPWWVELLFVQIGLPENLLVKVLSIKKKSHDHLSQKKKLYAALTSIFVIVIYINPLIRQASNYNYCISIIKDSLDLDIPETKEKNKKLKVIATNYCNGGNILGYTE